MTGFIVAFLKDTRTPSREIVVRKSTYEAVGVKESQIANCTLADYSLAINISFWNRRQDTSKLKMNRHLWF